MALPFMLKLLTIFSMFLMNVKLPVLMKKMTANLMKLKNGIILILSAD